jgi:hypothetical protein
MVIGSDLARGVRPNTECSPDSVRLDTRRRMQYLLPLQHGSNGLRAIGVQGFRLIMAQTVELSLTTYLCRDAGTSLGEDDFVNVAPTQLSQEEDLLLIALSFPESRPLSLRRASGNADHSAADQTSGQAGAMQA